MTITRVLPLCPASSGYASALSASGRQHALGQAPGEGPVTHALSRLCNGLYELRLLFVIVIVCIVGGGTAPCLSGRVVVQSRTHGLRGWVWLAGLSPRRCFARHVPLRLT